MPVVVVTAALLIIALASHAVPPRYGRDRPPSPASRASTSPRPRPTDPPARPRTGATSTHPLLTESTVYVLLAVVVAGIVWSLVTLLGGRVCGRRRGSPAMSDAPDVAAPHLAARIETAVDAGLVQLAEGPVADAIIACWLRLEDAASTAGIALRPSDTPSETVLRVLELSSRRPVRSGPLLVLAELYREARFSRHELGEPVRTAARAALEDIRADLARRDEAESAGDVRA